ncbi:MAG TPA: hypothetical protein VNO30_23115 [Kofleriaceae bacterium]|nr:hypothetical protein [Kofleriaceae bacterium]
MRDETFSFEIEADIYRISRRPNHQQIVVNDGYRGVRLLDPAEGCTIAKVPFTEPYARTGVIAGWCLRADGDAIVVFDDDERRGCWLSMMDGRASDVVHTPWPLTGAMPYDWRGDTLWLKDPDGFRFGSLSQSGAQQGMTERDGNDVLQENRGWRRAIDRLRRIGAHCVRVEPEHGRMLVARASDSSVGIIGWLDQPELVVPGPERMTHMAAHRQQLIVMCEYEAQLLDEAGRVQRRFAAPDGFHFVGLDTLPATGARSAVVVLAAQALGERLVTRFGLYAL